MVCGWARTLFHPSPHHFLKETLNVSCHLTSLLHSHFLIPKRKVNCECISHRNGKIKYMRAVYLRTIIKELCSLWKRSLNVEFVNYVYSQGSQGGTGGKEPACQCRRHKRGGFDPWVDKIPWRRKWQPTPAFLPGESHEWRSLVGYNP